MSVSTATSSPVILDLMALHRDAWAQAWADIGRLIELRDSGVELHEHRPWNFETWGPCHCFPCRVLAAWHWRHR